MCCWCKFLLWFILFWFFCDLSNLAPSVGLNSNSQTALQDIIVFVKSRYEEQNVAQGSKLQLTGRECNQKLSTGD